MASPSGPSLRSAGADFLPRRLGRMAALCLAGLACGAAAQSRLGTVEPTTAILAPGPATVAAQAPLPGAEPQLGAYDITLNTRTTGPPVLAARDAVGALWLDETALREWTVRLPKAGRARIDGLAMVRVDRVPGTRFEVDERGQAIALYLDPTLLAGPRFGLSPVGERPVARAPHWGGF